MSRKRGVREHVDVESSERGYVMCKTASNVSDGTAEKVEAFVLRNAL